MPRRTRWNPLLPIVAGLIGAVAAASPGPGLLSKWSFDGPQAGANSVPEGPAGTLERAAIVEGHAGKGLAFEDWSVKNYLKPDRSQATRFVVPDDPRLTPPFPFRVSAWIYATADPVYYGGIVEKGHGYGASYRLLLQRGLKVEASLGDQHLAVRSASPIPLNEWHEVTLVADGASLVLLVDGKEAARAAIAPGLKLASAAPLVIGERFTGRIDEISISSQ